MSVIKVLIVEDELLVARDLSQNLKREGFQVTKIASSVGAALQAIEEDPPNIVLMDIVIKGEQDGIDAASTIYERYRLPIVYLTAYADEQTLSRVERSPAYGYLLKPCKAKEVSTTIRMTIIKHQQAEQQNEEIARVACIKNEFLATMSHELRTPLTAILLMSQELKEEIFGAVTPDQFDALTTITSSGTHLLSLINDILDLAKCKSGQLKLDQTPTEIAPLCQSSINAITQQTSDKQVQITVNVSPQMPDIIIDARRIRQALINLLSNAVKFTPKGGQVTLESSIVETSDIEPSQYYLRLAVKDNGIGISSENINKLFQPFMQLDSALNRKYEGTGLGLALTKCIVDLHGGHVRVTSELNVGSCFTIFLPYSLNASCKNLISQNTWL